MAKSPDQRQQPQAPPTLGPRTGTWDWDVVTGCVTWDEPMERIFGFPPGGFDGTYDTATSPACTPTTGRGWRRRSSADLATATGHHIEHRVVLPDGTIRWVEGSGRTVLDAEGRVVRMIGVATDVTDHREVERAAAFLAALVATSDDAILAKDLNGTILSWNHAAEQMYGYPASEAIGRNVSMIFPKTARGDLDEIMAQIRRGERVEHLDTVRQRSDGTLLDISITTRRSSMAPATSWPHPPSTPAIAAQGGAPNAGRPTGTPACRPSPRRCPRRSRRRASSTWCCGRAQRRWAPPAVVALLDDTTDSLKIAGAHGYSADLLNAWADIPLTAHVPLTDAVGWANLVTISSPDEYAERYGDGPGLQEGTESVAAVPLAADRARWE